MDLNLTWEQIYDAEEFLNVKDDALEIVDHEIMASFERYILPLLFVNGLFLNIVALVILVRRSLWMDHEAYVYLAVILVNASLLLLAVYIPWWLALFHDSYHVAYASEVVCKLWILVTRLVQSNGWFQIAMLSSVYARLRIEATERRGATCSSNLCRRWCTLRGALTSAALLSCGSVVVNFWFFVNATVQHFGGEVRHCYPGNIFMPEQRYVKLGLNCIVNYVPVIILTPLLGVMIVASRIGRLGSAFNRMEGTTPSGVDAEDIGKVALWLALVLFVLRAPFYLLQMLDESRLFLNYKAYFTSYAFFLLHPVATPFVCFAVKSRFRQEARGMVEGCWSWIVTRSCLRHCRRQRTSLSVAWSNSGSTVVLQLDYVETDA